MTSLLRFEDVALRRGGRLLFEDLDLELGPGEALQVAGPNGSGKSSLIRLAAGLLRAERGSVERAAVALADDSLALDRELPLRRALGFWGGPVDAGDGRARHCRARATCRCGCCRPARSSARRSRGSRRRDAPLWLLDEPLNALDADGPSGSAR